MSTERYWQALQKVVDPEWPISVVDMGLIYDILEAGDGTVEVTMTYTSVGCACMSWIEEDIRRCLREAGAVSVRIEVIWDPPWTVERLTPEGRRILEQWGVATT